MGRNNRIISNVCKHIVNVFESDGTHLDYGEVLNKFEHFTMNESLVKKNKKTLDAIYCKCISNRRLMEFVVTQLYGKLNEGFFNPFNDEGQEDSDDFSDEYITVDKDSDVRDKDSGQKEDIVLVNDQCINGKIYMKDGKMFSGVNLFKGDVVEVCPVVPLDRTSMCARPVRELAFQISEKDPEKYGIPFGYANFYRTTDTTGLKGNVDYDYPEESEYMKIVAIDEIKPNDELILIVADDPNTITPTPIERKGEEELVNEGLKDFAKKAALGIGLGAATLLGGNSTASAKLADEALTHFAKDYLVLADVNSESSDYDKQTTKENCYNLALELSKSSASCYSGVGVSSVSQLDATNKGIAAAKKFYQEQTGKVCDFENVGKKYVTRTYKSPKGNRYSVMVILFDYAK